MAKPLVINAGLCIQPGCVNKQKTKHYCGLHYQRLWRGDDMDVPIRMHYKSRKCSIESCSRMAKGSSGFCQAHYNHKRIVRIRCELVAEGITPCTIAGCTKASVTGTSPLRCEKHIRKYVLTDEDKEQRKRLRKLKKFELPIWINPCGDYDFESMVEDFLQGKWK